jgi:GNAT superfamily N-acetyltransferase
VGVSLLPPECAARTDPRRGVFLKRGQAAFFIAWRGRVPRHMCRKVKSLTIKSVLVPPEYWNIGMPVLLMDEMGRRVQGKGCKWVAISLTSADNPATPGLAERMGAKIYKRYRVYLRAVD